MNNKFLFLVFVVFLIPFVGHSQENFDQDWYDKLNSPLEFIVYENFSTKLHSIRVYRGADTEYSLTIKEYNGNSIYNIEVSRNAEIDLTFLSCGKYIVEITNDKAIRCQMIEVK
jgi:hypothetical protein